MEERDKKRFWKFVSRQQSDECWEWTGAQRGGRAESGRYGSFWLDGKMQYTHRLSYEMHHGEIPENYEVDHKCENRLCCNPDHLRLLPRRSNRRRTSHRKIARWGNDSSGFQLGRDDVDSND